MYAYMSVHMSLHMFAHMSVHAHRGLPFSDPPRRVKQPRRLSPQRSDLSNTLATIATIDTSTHRHMATMADRHTATMAHRRMATMADGHRTAVC